MAPLVSVLFSLACLAILTDQAKIDDIPNVTYLTKNHPAFKAAFPRNNNTMETDQSPTIPSGRSMLTSFELFFETPFEFNFRRLVLSFAASPSWYAL